jgi:hypothetical protein
VHNLELDALRKELAEVSAERSYWRARGEQLIDAALARAGAIHQPTMEQRPRELATSMLSQIVSAAGMSEFDSSQTRKAAQSYASVAVSGGLQPACRGR